MNNIFAKRLRELRVEKNIMQMDLAKELNIAKTTYSNYEQGRREPNFETLTILSKYFNVSADYLIGNSNIKNLNDANRLNKRAESLSWIKNKNSVFGIIDSIKKIDNSCMTTIVPEEKAYLWYIDCLLEVLEGELTVLAKFRDLTMRSEFNGVENNTIFLHFLNESKRRSLLCQNILGQIFEITSKELEIIIENIANPPDKAGQ